MRVKEKVVSFFFRHPLLEISVEEYHTEIMQGTGRSMRKMCTKRALRWRDRTRSHEHQRVFKVREISHCRRKKDKKQNPGKQIFRMSRKQGHKNV